MSVPTEVDPITVEVIGTKLLAAAEETALVSQVVQNSSAEGPTVVAASPD